MEIIIVIILTIAVAILLAAILIRSLRVLAPLLLIGLIYALFSGSQARQEPVTVSPTRLAIAAEMQKVVDKLGQPASDTPAAPAVQSAWQDPVGTVHLPIDDKSAWRPLR